MKELKWQTAMDFPRVTNPLQQLHMTLAFTSRDCGEDKMIAWIYGIILGWDDASFEELKYKHRWSDADIEYMKLLHINYEKAWNLFMNEEEGSVP